MFEVELPEPSPELSSIRHVTEAIVLTLGKRKSAEFIAHLEARASSDENVYVMGTHRPERQRVALRRSQKAGAAWTRMIAAYLRLMSGRKG